MKGLAVLAALLTALLPINRTSGHEVRPGYLELTETDTNTFQMLWKVPALGAFRLGIEPQLPGFCRFITDRTSTQTCGAFVVRDASTAKMISAAAKLRSAASMPR